MEQLRGYAAIVNDYVRLAYQLVPKHRNELGTTRASADVPDFADFHAHCSWSMSRSVFLSKWEERHAA